MKFTGTKDYVATDDLKVAVNASIVLERPLLIKGEPGTGKTVLAEEIAKALGAPLITWYPAAQQYSRHGQTAPGWHARVSRAHSRAGPWNDLLLIQSGCELRPPTLPDGRTLRRHRRSRRQDVRPGGGSLCQ